MKLDMNQPHGTVTGHPEARYEQGGRLFDGRGEPLLSGPAPQAKTLSLGHGIGREEAAAERQAEEFLRALLSGGRVAKSIVYRESENSSQDWEAVKDAFSRIGAEQHQKGTAYWVLRAE